MSHSNVRVMTNVLCYRKDGRTITNEEIGRRLNYFQVLELCRRNPILYSPLRDLELTAVQRAQRDAFLREATLSLWKVRPELQPIVGTAARNPFLAPAPERGPQAHEIADAGKREAKKVVVPPPLPPKPLRAPLEAKPPSPEEKDRMVKADPSRDMLVVAPPGTGKTWAVVARIAHLVSKGFSKSPATDFLVLSFTRSAVSEVRRRLREKASEPDCHPNVAYARVLTFDSLATRCLMLDRDPDSLRGLDFNERIGLFNALLDGELPRATEDLRKIRFLLVDEVQDLIGQRARMVLKLARIVKENGGAVCFLGDPAQAIYDYDESANKVMSSAEFLSAVVAGKYWTSPPDREEFENYRRFETDDMRAFVVQARQAMGADGLHPDGSRIEELVTGLGTPRAMQEHAAAWSAKGSRAILTRNNLEAYQIWRKCLRSEINAELWRGASGGYWPGWIGRLVLGFRQETMSMEMARRRWDEHIASLVPIGFEDAVKYLETEGVIEDARIDLRRLNHVISIGSPIGSARSAAAAVTISTIHRSKGLEFDEVFIYRPSNDFAGDDSEVRIIYVAATRARRSLSVLAEDKGIKWGAKNPRRYSLRTNHFHLTAYPKYPSMGLLLDGADEVDWRSELKRRPAEELVEAAKLLWQLGGGGTPRDALLEKVGSSGPMEVIVAGKRLGVPSGDVVDDLDGIAQFQGSQFARLSGVEMFDVATHAHDWESGAAEQVFGTARLCLAPVLSGIGEVMTR